MPATGAFSLLWVLIVLPLLGAGILLAGGRRTNKWGPYLAILMVVADAVIGLFMVVQMFGMDAEQRGVTQVVYSWVSTGAFHVDVAFHLDQLSMVFVLLITIVGSLIHVYSLGYMAHDPDKRRFFGMLNLFIAAMLTLVLADNYLLLYVGWEGVGLASFLLISFWQFKPSAAAAGKKAFIINRIGDVGLSLAIMLMFVTFGSVSFEQVFGVASQANENTLTAIGLLLLLAAAGKSAQFPLHSWLLDAMEGPTPVSALIHAATMVTAGVYLIVRSNAIFDNAPWALVAVIVVGMITMVLGALIGTAKDDIKKSLAGSTMSQIGYMITAAGLGPIGYVFAIFHLLMHGVFKAGLFLGAGSVMHGMHDNVNMRRYGALKAAMAVTFVTFFVDTLAIMGIPPFDGFFSKDDIIHAAFERSPIIGIVGMLVAGLTGFYMFRMASMTFFGKARWEEGVHPHESPKVMTIPLILLAIGATFGGMALVYWGDIESWLEPVTGIETKELPFPAWAYELTTLTIVVIGAAIAYVMYARREVPLTAPRGTWFTRAARESFYDNEINEGLVVRPSYWLARVLTWSDTKVVDGVVNGTAALIGGTSGRLRKYQNGFARSYAVSMVGGAVLLLLALILVRLS